MSRHTSHLSLRVTERRIEIILNVLQEKHSAESCTHYGEPGYQDPEIAIVFCNWNDVPERVGEYLEEAGYKTEWQDEWIIDYDHQKAYRTSPDSYSWSPQFRITPDGEILTPDDPASAWIELCQNDPNNALPDWIGADDMLSEGFELDQAEFENGHFLGQSDSPSTIAEALQARPEVADYVFQLTEQSQFYCRFRVWVRQVEEETHEQA